MVKCALGGAADARTRIKTSPPSQAKKTSGAMSVERCTGALRETKMKTAQREECHTGAGPLRSADDVEFVLCSESHQRASLSVL